MAANTSKVRVETGLVMIQLMGSVFPVYLAFSEEGRRVNLPGLNPTPSHSQEGCGIPEEAKGQSTIERSAANDGVGRPMIIYIRARLTPNSNRSLGEGGRSIKQLCITRFFCERTVTRAKTLGQNGFRWVVSQILPQGITLSLLHMIDDWNPIEMAPQRRRG